MHSLLYPTLVTILLALGLKVFQLLGKSSKNLDTVYLVLYLSANTIALCLRISDTRVVGLSWIFVAYLVFAPLLEKKISEKALGIFAIANLVALWIALSLNILPGKNISTPPPSIANPSQQLNDALERMREFKRQQESNPNKK